MSAVDSISSFKQTWDNLVHREPIFNRFGLIRQHSTPTSLLHYSVYKKRKYTNNYKSTERFQPSISPHYFESPRLLINLPPSYPLPLSPSHVQSCPPCFSSPQPENRIPNKNHGINKKVPHLVLSSEHSTVSYSLLPEPLPLCILCRVIPSIVLIIVT